MWTFASKWPNAWLYTPKLGSNTVLNLLCRSLNSFVWLLSRMLSGLTLIGAVKQSSGEERLMDVDEGISISHSGE